MRPAAEKTIANGRESAQVATMSERPDVFVRRYADVDMTMRSRRETVHFRHSFRIKGIDRLLPPGWK
jgi:hypothetical protein